MPNIVICDTSCFIILGKINELNILKDVYGSITTTPEIAKEYGLPLQKWIHIEEVKDKLRQNILELQVDKGEASAIALATEKKESTLILDDAKARRIAQKLKLNYTGTIGIIIKAKLLGRIDSIQPILNKIAQTNFHISDELKSLALKLANENPL